MQKKERWKKIEKLRWYERVKGKGISEIRWRRGLQSKE